MKIVRDLLNVKIMANSSLMTQEMKRQVKVHEDKVIDLDSEEMESMAQATIARMKLTKKSNIRTPSKAKERTPKGTPSKAFEQVADETPR
jgi:hypothetical protein